MAALIISSSEDDHSYLTALLAEAGQQTSGARSIDQALTILRAEPFATVICERDLPDGGWKHVQEALADKERAPELIVTSALADESLWAEVLNLGGYDVLLKPFDATEVLRVTTLAGESWKRRHAGKNGAGKSSLKWAVEGSRSRGSSSPVARPSAPAEFP